MGQVPVSARTAGELALWMQGIEGSVRVPAKGRGKGDSGGPRSLDDSRDMDDLSHFAGLGGAPGFPKIGSPSMSQLNNAMIGVGDVYRTHPAADADLPPEEVRGNGRGMMCLELCGGFPIVHDPALAPDQEGGERHEGNPEDGGGVQ